MAVKGLFPLPAEHMNGSSVRDGGADSFSVGRELGTKSFASGV